MRSSALRIQLALFVALSLAALWAFTLYDLQRRERDAVASAEARTLGMAHAFAENAHSTIQRIDLVLIELGRTWVSRPGDFVAEIHRHEANISDISIQVSIADKDGWLVFSNLGVPASRVSIADREHFRVHAGAAESRLFISRPVLGRVSKKWSVQFTRPLIRDGSFDGVIIVSVSPELFSRFYQALSLGEQGVTMTVGDGGDVIARAPDWERFMGRAMAGNPFTAAGAPRQGNFVATSPVDDGIERVYGYYRLPDYRLTLVAALSMEEVLAPLVQPRWIMLGTAAAVSAMLVIMAFWILASLAARERTEQALRQTAEELRSHREHLEEEVAARTEDLVRANADLATANAQLVEAEGMLVQSEKMASLGQLAAGVAHEINNPIGFVNSNLGSIQGYIRDLVTLIEAYEKHEDGLGEHRQEVLDTKRSIDLDYIRADLAQVLDESKEGLSRVKRIVDDLRSFSHVGSSRWEFADLHAGLDSTLNIINNEIKYKATVSRDYGQLPQVECVPGEINQVFMNLLVNGAHAIKDAGEIRIRTGAEGGDVWIEIADTGCGIPPENLTRIFDPFFTTKPVGTGTGLGLYLAYSTVKKHHGRIEVDSVVGEGTTFKVWLPSTQPESGHAEAEGAAVDGDS